MRCPTIRCVVHGSLPGPAKWALGLLRSALEVRGEVLGIQGGRSEIVVCLAEDWEISNRMCPEAPESLAIQRQGDRLIITGRDARGLVYALTEAARAVELAASGKPVLDAVCEAVESPELTWRSMQMFLFNEELERQWYFSERFWDGYLTQLVLCRYNNFSLTFAHQTPYLSPPYPYLVEMPEFPQVKVAGLDAQQRDENLRMLQRISEMAQQRGLHFTFAVWSQDAETYGDSPITGLDTAILADYNTAALAKVLEAWPDWQRQQPYFVIETVD